MRLDHIQILIRARNGDDITAVARLSTKADVIEAIQELQAGSYLTKGDDTPPKITEKGAVFLDALTKVPAPIPTWKMPVANWEKP